MAFYQPFQSGSRHDCRAMGFHRLGAMRWVVRGSKYARACRACEYVYVGEITEDYKNKCLNREQQFPPRTSQNDLDTGNPHEGTKT